MSARGGFTIIELIIIIGLIGVLVVLGLPFIGSFGPRQDVFAAGRGVVSALRRAQFRSMLAEGGTNVWVRVVAGTGTAYVIYQGTSYAARDRDTEELYALPDTVGIGFSFPNATSTLDLRFSRYDGKPAATGTLFLTSNIGGSSTIRVGTQGQITQL